MQGWCISSVVISALPGLPQALLLQLQLLAGEAAITCQLAHATLFKIPIWDGDHAEITMQGIACCNEIGETCATDSDVSGSQQDFSS